MQGILRLIFFLRLLGAGASNTDRIRIRTGCRVAANSARITIPAYPGDV